MANEHLIGKLEALLNKHRQAANGPEDQAAEIPLLTEIAEEVLNHAAQYPELAGPEQEAPPQQAIPLSDEAAEALAREIFQRVMNHLEHRLTGELRDQLTARLSAIIDDTVATAIADFKQELANTVGDAIAEALVEHTQPRESVSPDTPSD